MVKFVKFEVRLLLLLLGPSKGVPGFVRFEVRLLVLLMGPSPGIPVGKMG